MCLSTSREFFPKSFSDLLRQEPIIIWWPQKAKARGFPIVGKEEKNVGRNRRYYPACCSPEVNNIRSSSNVKKQDEMCF